MEDIKLIIIWDEVIGDIIEHIKNGIAGDKSKLLHEVVLEPLLESMIGMLDALQRVGKEPFIMTSISQVLEYLCMFMYLGCLFYLLLQTVLKLLQNILQPEQSGGLLGIIIQPLKTTIILQFLQFVGVPLLLNFLEVLPKILHVIDGFVAGIQQKEELHTIPLFKQELQLFQLLLLAIILVSLVVILLHYTQLGLQLLVAFLLCYFLLMQTTELALIFAKLKHVIFRMTVLYFLQQLLITAAQHTTVQENDVGALLGIAAIVLYTSYIPKIITNERIEMYVRATRDS